MDEHFSDVAASGAGAAKLHERLFGTDPVNVVLTVGDLAVLCDRVYEPKDSTTGGGDVNYVPKDVNGCAISSWTCVKTFPFPGNVKHWDALLKPDRGDSTEQQVDGFFAALFTDGMIGRHYVLAFRGTDKPQIEDWVTDYRQAFGRFTWQYANAAQIVAEELPKYLETAETLTFTGHSLGGGLAALASYMVPQIPTITFNAAGLHESSKALAIRYAPVGTRWDHLRHPKLGPTSLMPSLWNYHVANEVLTTVQEDPGRLLGKYYKLEAAGWLLDSIKHLDIPKASRNNHLIPGVQGKSSIDRHMMDTVMSALGVSGLDRDKLTYADAIDPVAAVKSAYTAPRSAPPPPPPSSGTDVGSTSSDADDD